MERTVDHELVQDSQPSLSDKRARNIPPRYMQTEDVSHDRLEFFHILERLKTQKRTGWVDHSIPDAESISDHMYRMSVLALCGSDEKLDVAKCVMLAVVHDLAEAHVGDIAPREGYSKEDKRKLEKDAMLNFCHDMLHSSPAAQRIMNLWEEYEAQETREAQFVKDLDRFEMACQADEYEKRHDIDLQPFFDSSLPHLRHQEVIEWGRTLHTEREARLSAPARSSQPQQ